MEITVQGLWFWWKRGVTLLLALWVIQLLVGLPLFLISFLLPTDFLTSGWFSVVLKVIYICVGPIVFYFVAYTFGLRFINWIKEDAEILN